VAWFNYRYRFGMEQGLFLLLQLVIGTAFVVFYCGFLARKRYSPMLWLALVFSVIGTVANNFYWIAMAENASFSLVNTLGLWRTFFISSGLPLSSLIGPFVTSRLGREIYLAIVVNIDCALKVAFLISAIAKYHTESPPSPPSSAPRTPNVKPS
jgi:magnesium-transporting ATPase (P-type)